MAGLVVNTGIHCNAYQEAQEALRSRVDSIVLQPSALTGKLDILQAGVLSDLPTLALGIKRKNGLRTPVIGL